MRTKGQSGILPLGLLIISLVSSCVTFNHKNPYPNMEIVHYGSSQAYVFKNASSSNRLIINIEGSGWDSVLGTKNDKRWLMTHQGAQLLQVLNDRYTFFIPEKLNRQPGFDYSKETADRSNYTSGKILDCYMESINGYLNEHFYSSIILIGSSEGAVLLPLIYERMDAKDSVTAMVSIAFGGFSLYESYKILSASPRVSQEFRKMYSHIIEVFDWMEDYKSKNENVNITPEEDFYGFNYRWFDSFLSIRPFDYYRYITIPVLFVHGKKDQNVPVESTQYVQENLPEKPYEYKYYEWAHQPNNYFGIIDLRNDISEWIRKIDA
jgi:esterase/lipase